MIAPHERGSPRFQEPQLSANLSLVERLEAVAERLGTTLPPLAVAWTLHVDGVSGAIVGARRADQVDGWIPGATLQIDAEALEEIEAATSETGAGEG